MTRDRFLFRVSPTVPSKEAISVAPRKVFFFGDCGKEVGENKGAALRVTFTDARRGSKVADLCDPCAAKMPGRAAARRGRRPKLAAACRFKVGACDAAPL